MRWIDGRYGDDKCLINPQDISFIWATREPYDSVVQCRTKFGHVIRLSNHDTLPQAQAAMKAIAASIENG